MKQDIFERTVASESTEREAVYSFIHDDVLFSFLSCIQTSYVS